MPNARLQLALDAIARNRRRLKPLVCNVTLMPRVEG